MITREEARRKFDLLSDYEKSSYYKSAAFIKNGYLQTSMSDYELARNIYVNRLLASENGSEEKSKTSSNS